MTEVKKVAKYLILNPKAFIYYHDRGEWSIYESKQDWKKEKDPVWNCVDYNHYGYIPFIADVLAEVCKIKIDTI
jgi:hypothetical protein